MAEPVIQTSDLARTFQALRSRDPSKISKQIIEEHPDYKRVPRHNYSPTAAVNTGSWGSGMSRFASSAGVVYGQPAFFSPVHTPINWQIPSKRLEEYQWSRFFYCLTPDNQVLMSDGTEKKICDIVVGDRIIDENGNIQRVMRVHTRDIDEDISELKIGGSNTKISITNSHEIKVVKKEEWEKSYQTVHSERRKQERIKKFGKVDITESWNEVGNIKIGDCVISPELKPTSKFMPDMFSDRVCWLLGLFAADGSYYWYNYKNERKYPKGIRITLSNDEKNTIGEKARKIIEDELGFKTKEYKNGHGKCYDIVLHNVVIAKLFYSIIGDGCLGKKLCSEFINNASESQLLNFIAGISDGDGCVSNTFGDQIRISSQPLASQLRVICTKLNLSHSVSWSTQKTRICKTNILNESPSCNIRIGRMACEKLNGICEKYSHITPAHHHKIREYIALKNKMYRKIIDIQHKHYCGKVYDLEIENNHTYCINGCVVHNSNEPKVASAIDFYSDFPMSDWEHECRNRDVKLYFDRFKKRLKLPKWCRLISHEVHLLGDCFPFLEIECPHCQGSGKLGDEICDHEGGTIRRMVILNPDYVEVYTSPVNPDAIIALRPDEELINMVQRKTPGYERLSPEVIKLISSGQPIRLDNRNVTHLKYGECGYTKYGIGMVRRLFPILSYKTKLMVAQWIVAERLIVPIKIVKVGSDERPAGPADIADVQAQLAMTAQDPNLTIITHHAFELDFVGAAGRVLTLSNEFEFINQEVLDGMMINNALLNGEGPNFSSAAVGIEAMIQRLETFRQEISQWIEQSIYLPESKRQGFIDKNPETGEEEYLIPKIKWGSMHLRDQQQYRTFMIQLYDKGVISAQTLLESFDLDPDQEIERKRYDALQMMALGQGFGQQQGGAAGGGFGGGGGGGGGGLPPLGGGGAPPIGAPGEMGGAGGAPGGGPSPVGGGVGGPPMAKASSMTAEVADPNQFGGRVLKKKTRERLAAEQKKIFQQQEVHGVGGKDAQGQTRDEKGRVIFTKCERALIPRLMKAQQEGLIESTIIPQYRVRVGAEEYSIDFGIPDIKIGIEADGEIFHSSGKQITHDKERDMKLAQQGWTILRFTDVEIDNKLEQVIRTVIQSIMRKKLSLQQQAGQAQDQKTFDTPEAPNVQPQ